ncbi:hypothetical protein PENTCL1PPCAC_19479, partial [Pristionchus entomophagus]
LQAHKDFKRLVSMCSSRWGKKYWMRKKSDPDTSVRDLAVDEEVETRQDEGWKTWDAMYAKAGTNEGYEIDYIVGQIKRIVGEEIKGRYLIKFTKYPVCSWEERKRIKLQKEEYRSRCFHLDFIEIRLRVQLGDAEFERRFPNRYLTDEKGDGKGGYVKNKRSLYHNDLRALESRWAYICARAGLPTLYIEDWTNEPHDFESLKQLEVSSHIIAVSDAKSASDSTQLFDCRCNSTCSKCDAKQRSQKHKHCCGISESVDINENSGEFKWCEKGKPCELQYTINYECTENCACKERECKNRPVQRGRQHVLCIFREP